MNSPFPAAYSTLSPIALASFLAAQYALQQVECRLIVRGVGDTYEVNSSSGRYILRAYRHDQRSHAQVQEETGFLTALHEAGIWVAYPIKDITGQVIQTINAIEGARCAVLSSYAPGHIAHTLNEQQLRNLGNEVARMHNVAVSFPVGNSRWTFNIETIFFRSLELLHTHFAEDTEGYEWLRQATHQVERKLSTLNTDSFPQGYCHFDLLTKNIHFDGDKPTIFDFDFMGSGWLVNDIMTFLQQLWLDVHYNRMTQEQADSAYAIFIAGYKEYRAISGNELEAVPYLALGFWVFYSAFHTTHDQFHTFVQQPHLKMRFTLVRRIIEKYWEPEYLPKKKPVI